MEGKTEGRTEVKGRRGRRRKQLLDNLKEKKGYWELKEEALDRNTWRTRFGRGYGPVVRRTAECTNECRGSRFHQSTGVPLLAYMGRHSVAGITTSYRLEGPRIDPGWGARFSAPIQTVHGHHTLPPQEAMGLSSWGRRGVTYGLQTQHITI